MQREVALNSLAGFFWERHELHVDDPRTILLSIGRPHCRLHFDDIAFEDEAEAQPSALHEVMVELKGDAVERQVHGARGALPDHPIEVVELLGCD